MSYVDIGWPSGLCILAMHAFWFGSGWWVRRWAVSALMFLHGFRMFAGALHMFYPYTFPNGDLSRYQYAKWRWTQIHEQPVEWWPVKQQQETLSQGLANSVGLAALQMYDLNGRLVQVCTVLPSQKEGEKIPSGGGHQIHAKFCSHGRCHILEQVQCINKCYRVRRQ